MSIEQMRDALKRRYPGSRKFDKMSDNQIMAVYMRLLNSGKL